MSSPIIVFGQQPCGFFPKRFLVAKIQTARRLQSEIGGDIVYFCHDSDHDHRETRTILRHRKTGGTAALNFAVENKIQRKFAPLFLKRISPDWQAKTILQLPNYIRGRLIDIFKQASGGNVTDFCLNMYRGMDLLDNIRVVRSSEPAIREAACDIAEFFVDVPYQGEIVRARFAHDHLQLHEGGDAFVRLPLTAFTKREISPARDSRLRWMQSAVRCTHYVAGPGEHAYLRQEEAPEVIFVARDPIERCDEAFIDLTN